MKTIGLATAVLVSAFVLGGAERASAELVTATFTGTVTGDTITTLDSQSSSSQYVGDTMSVRITIDTTFGTLFSAPGINSLGGGTARGTQSPVVAATVTIGGTTFNPAGAYNGFGQQQDDYLGSYNAIVYGAADYTVQNIGGALLAENYSDAVGSIYSSTPFVTTDITQPLTYYVQPSDTAMGSWDTYTEVVDPFGPVEVSYYEQDIAFTPTVVTVVDGVPEPATWAMMLIGFAGVAAASKSRYGRRIAA